MVIGYLSAGGRLFDGGTRSNTHPRFINASATDHANRSPSALAVDRPSSSTRTNDRTVARSKIRAHSRHSTANVLASCEC